jgi:hypothetical protein
VNDLGGGQRVDSEVDMLLHVVAWRDDEADPPAYVLSLHLSVKTESRKKERKRKKESELDARNNKQSNK